jgi:hypothetical protein
VRQRERARHHDVADPVRAVVDGDDTKPRRRGVRQPGVQDAPDAHVAVAGERIADRDAVAADRVERSGAQVEVERPVGPRRIQAGGLPAVAFVGEVAIEEEDVGRDHAGGCRAGQLRRGLGDRRRQAAAFARDEHAVGQHPLGRRALGRALRRGEADRLRSRQRDDERDRGADGADAEAPGRQRAAREEAGASAGLQRTARERGWPTDHDRRQQRDRDHEAERRQRRERDRLGRQHGHERDAAAERD